MPAKSKQQRRAAAIAMKIKKGEMKPRPGSASAQMAEMPAATLQELAGTPEANLPKYARPMGKKENLRRMFAKKNLRSSF